MTKVFFLTLAMAVSTALHGQTASEPATATASGPAASAKPQNADRVQSGTVLSVELSKALDTKKCKADDKIEARTVTDMLQHGQIVIPRNTKIVGRVTEAKAHSKDSPGATVAIIFDRMRLKDGREVPLQLTVQAVGRPLSGWSTPIGSARSAESPAGAPPSMEGQRVPMANPPSVAGGGSQYPRGDPDGPAGARDSNTSTASPLNLTSHGVVGIKGLSLDTAGPVSKLNSTTGNVHLDSGTQLILRVM